MRFALMIAAVFLALGCSSESPEVVPSPGAGLANPASEYCAENGGTEENRSGEGGEYGVCVFPDGSECESFAYMRGECAPGEDEPE